MAILACFWQLTLSWSSSPLIIRTVFQLSELLILGLWRHNTCFTYNVQHWIGLTHATSASASCVKAFSGWIAGCRRKMHFLQSPFFVVLHFCASSVCEKAWQMLKDSGFGRRYKAGRKWRSDIAGEPRIYLAETEMLTRISESIFNGVRHRSVPEWT